MKEQEAIEELSGMYRICAVDSLNGKIEAENKNNAIDMAIEALEKQKRMKDCYGYDGWIMLNGKYPLENVDVLIAYKDQDNGEYKIMISSYSDYKVGGCWSVGKLKITN